VSRTLMQIEQFAAHFQALLAISGARRARNQ
jgi:hypothetical protein